MNSSLEQDYDEFQFSKEIKLETTDIEDGFSNLRDLLHCEVCNQKFDDKKDLRNHLLAHIRQPKVLLERISDIKKAKKEQSDKFWSEPEQKSTLKITLKLKKSPASESFTVVSNNLEIEKESSEREYELADVEKNDCKSDSEEEEKTVEQSSDNVILDQENDYEDNENDANYINDIDEDHDINHDHNVHDDHDDNDEIDGNEENDHHLSNYDDENFEDEQNPLENSERPLMDNNEGDSGVGSDTANHLEREDQNMDDLQVDNNSNSDQNEIAENEDHEVEEESDALEATCRETIENLKKLGELKSRSSEILEPRAPSEENEMMEEEDEEQEVIEEENETENNEEEPTPINPIEELQSKREISIVPKSALMPAKPSVTTHEAETEIVPIGGGTSSSFSWNKVVNEDSNSNKSRDSSHHSMDKNEAENAENAGSILQNFLIEQQRSQNESRDLPLETEYVSLDRLAESVNTCKVCNEKFKDIAHLDAHKSKVGHFQCNVTDCSSLVFKTPTEVSVHKTQVHGPPISPNIPSSSTTRVSPHNLSQTHSPHSQSPHLSQRHSPLMNAHSPHSPSVQVLQHPSRNSPITSPHNNSPSISAISQQQVYPPVNLEQLPAPVQQLAQQVQRMPLPQPAQLPPTGMPGGPPMMPHGAPYYPGTPGRPPMYARVQGPPMGYPPNLAMYAQQYAAAAAAASNPYQQMGLQPHMQAQISQQQMPRSRYPAMHPAQRQQRLSQHPQPSPSTVTQMQRMRMKRPMTQVPNQLPQTQIQQQHIQGASAAKQRRTMDVLLPDRNEDADCHVIAQQKRNDGLPVIQNVQGGTSVQQQQSSSSISRTDSTIHLTDSITLSVRQPAQINANVQSKKPDASAVANVLAARGITVTPATAKKNIEQTSSSSSSSQSPQQQQSSSAKQPSVVSTLNLNSAISIIPAGSRKQQQQQQQQQQEQSGQFAVPQNKQSKQATNEVERPPRPPTVDLTQDNTPAQPVRRGRPPRMLQSLTCQICDKRFQSQEILSQHMATHRTTNKIAHKCNLCPAQYPTSQALAMHKKTYHKEVDTTIQNNNIELAIPVVDFKSPATLARLNQLGIQSYIPLSQLSAMTGGNYGLPIVTIDGARNSNTNNLAALGATSILSLGTLKQVTNR